MKGKAKAPGVITVVNAIGPLKGSSFAVNKYTEAKVKVKPEEEKITGEISENPEEDTEMIELCIEKVFNEFDVNAGAHVTTKSDIPIASGMASSSAAANAAVLAALDAIDEEMEKKEATRLGVQASIDAGVTVTGAIDDAWASMLGGIVMSNNEENTLVKREELNKKCAIHIPNEKEKTVDTDIERSNLVADVAEEAFNLAVEGKIGEAMTVNGFAYCAALNFDEEKIMEALEHAEGANLSGTGPSFGAIGTAEQMKKVKEKWQKHSGKTLILDTVNEGGEKL